MKLRVILVCALLLLAASPSFAAVAVPPAAPCQACNVFNLCERSAGSGMRCAYDQSSGDCYTFPYTCVDRAPLAEEWTVASIEISRPSLDSITITAPAKVAEVREPEPNTQK